LLIVTFFVIESSLPNKRLQTDTRTLRLVMRRVFP